MNRFRFGPFKNVKYVFKKSEKIYIYTLNILF